MKHPGNDDLFFLCTVVEYVARQTHNHVRDIVNKLSDEEFVMNG